jgi:Skp family chaperone for outer membrane proteins
MQFGQQMNQSQMMVMQKIYDHVSRASEKVAKDMGLELVVQEDSALYFAPGLDITQPVLQTMDKMFDEEATAVETPKETPKK